MEKDIEILKESESTSRIKLLGLPVVVSLLALVAIVTTKTPGRGGPIVVMLFLLCIFILVLSISAIILKFISRFIGTLNMSGIRVFYTSVALASGVVFLLGLQTLRQLQPIDLILVLVFELLLNFYLLRRF